MINETCDVCGSKLIWEDEYITCPVYLAGKDKESDEHTSIYRGEY